MSEWLGSVSGMPRQKREQTNLIPALCAGRLCAPAKEFGDVDRPAFRRAREDVAGVLDEGSNGGLNTGLWIE